MMQQKNAVVPPKMSVNLGARPTVLAPPAAGAAGKGKLTFGAKPAAQK